MSLDELFKTMHSDFKDFTTEADKFISNHKQKNIKAKSTKDDKRKSTKG